MASLEERISRLEKKKNCNYDCHAIHDNLDSEINGITEKLAPVGDDELVIEDSGDGFKKKKIKVSSLPSGGGTDAHAIHDNVSGEISAIVQKITPDSTDILLIEDVFGGNVKKSVEIGSLPITESQIVDLTHYTNTDFDNRLATKTTDDLSEGSTNKYNATHTGEVTGSGALTLNPTAISNKVAKTPLAGTEEVLINDAGTLKKTTAQDIADLGGGTGGSLQDSIIVASSTSYNSSIADYVCNGTNDHVEINNAISSAVAAGKARVLLLNGTYDIGGSIVIDDAASGITLQAESVGNVLIQASTPLAADTPYVDIQSTAGVSDVTIDGIKMDALNRVNATSTSAPGVIGASITTGPIDRLKVINCYVETKGTFNQPFNISDHSGSGSDWEFYGNNFLVTGTTTASNYGFQIQMPVSGVRFNDNYIKLTNNGVNVMFNAFALYGDCQNFTVTNNIIITAGKGHSSLAISTSANGTVVGNYVQHDTPHTAEFGIEIENKIGHSATGGICKNVIVAGNTVVIGDKTDNTTGGIVVRDYDGTANVPKNITVSGNTITGAYTGVYFNGIDGGVLGANQCYNCTNDFNVNQNKTKVFSNHYINNWLFDETSMNIGETGNWVTGTQVIGRTASTRTQFGSNIFSYDSGNARIGDAGSPADLEHYGGTIEVSEFARSVGHGEQCLNSLDTSADRYCVAIGYRAAYLNTTGSDIVAIGRNAVSNNDTGIGTVGIGYFAASGNTTGFGNIGIGYQALQANQAGRGNVSLGYRANYLNTSGNYNISIGEQSNLSQTSGSYITAIGYKALFSNDSGQKSTAIGGLSLGLSTTATDTHAIGYKAGYRENGNNCLFLGSGTGRQIGGVQTLNGRILIGHNAGQNNTEANVLIIGNSSTSELIKGDFTTGRVTMEQIMRVKPIAGDPAVVSDGDIWYNNILNSFRKRANGITTNF